MLLFVEPPTYGRLPAGVSSTIAIHQPADTTIANPDASNCRMRRRNGVGAAMRYTRPNAGTTRKACSILVRKPKPTAEPAAISHQVLPASRARTTQYAASTSSSTSNASGLLNRNITTATGVNARTSPASRPATEPNQRRTVAYNSATVATPSSACGTNMLQLENPNIRPESSITHNDAGGLSTVMKFDESNEPNRNARQLFVPACTAAA